MISVIFLSLSLLNCVFSYNKAATAKKLCLRLIQSNIFFQYCYNLLQVINSHEFFVLLHGERQYDLSIHVYGSKALKEHAARTQHVNNCKFVLQQPVCFRVWKELFVITTYLACQKWYSEDLPQVAQTLARYGHSAVANGRFVKHTITINLKGKQEDRGFLSSPSLKTNPIIWLHV